MQSIIASWGGVNYPVIDVELFLDPNAIKSIDSLKPLHDALKVYLESHGLPYVSSAYGIQLKAINDDLTGPKVLVTMQAPQQPQIESVIKEIQGMGRQGQIGIG
jgi:hypothetical protein